MQHLFLASQYPRATDPSSSWDYCPGKDGKEACARCSCSCCRHKSAMSYANTYLTWDTVHLTAITCGCPPSAAVNWWVQGGRVACAPCIFLWGTPALDQTPALQYGQRPCGKTRDDGAHAHIIVGKTAHLSGLPLKAQQLLACEQSFSTSKRDSGSVIVPSSSSFACSPGATSDDNILSALVMEPASPQAWSW